MSVNDIDVTDEEVALVERNPRNAALALRMNQLHIKELRTTLRKSHSLYCHLGCNHEGVCAEVNRLLNQNEPPRSNQ